MRLGTLSALVLAAALVVALPASATDRLPAPDLSGYSFEFPQESTATTAVVLATARDGAMLVSGTFEAVNGTARPGLARIGADSTFDAGWNPAVPTGFLGVAAVEEPDGAWLIAGRRFVMEGLVAELFRVDPLTGNTQLVYTAPAGSFIDALALDPSGSIYVAIGGSPGSPPVEVPAFVYRISSDGTHDHDFQVVLSGQYGWCFPGQLAPMPRVSKLVHDGGRLLYIGGNFSAASGGAELVSAPGIARTATDLPPEPPAAAKAGSPVAKTTCLPVANPQARALALGSDHRLYLGGDFGFASVPTGDGFAAAVAALPSGTRAGLETSSDFVSITGIAVDSARNRVYVAGNFHAVDGEGRPGLAALSTLPGHALDPDWSPATGGVQPFVLDDRVLVAGSGGPQQPADLAFAYPLAGVALLNHYYQAILGRAPDASGLAYWPAEVQRLAALGIDPREAYIAMAMFFFGSPEFAGTGLTDAQFVDRLYLTFLGRAADAPGRDFWLSMLAQGFTREMVMFAFMFSQEFDAYMDAALGATPSRAEVGVVVDFYRGALGRLPDAGGLRYWVNRFREAQCAAPGTAPGLLYAAAKDISASFFQGEEYAAKGGSDADYVSDLYNAFLRRSADLGGFQHWVDQVAQVGRESVRQAFIDSPEFGGRVAAMAAESCAPPMP